MSPYVSAPWSAVALAPRHAHTHVLQRTLSLAPRALPGNRRSQLKPARLQKGLGRGLAQTRYASQSAGSAGGPSSHTLLKEKDSADKEKDALQLTHAVLLSLPSRTHPSPAHGVEDSIEETDLADLVSVSEELLHADSPSSTKVRVAVYGPDAAPSARTLVAALLDDPLSTDEALHDAIRDRWKDAPDDVQQFEHAPSISSSADTTALPSPFLTRFAGPISLTELRSPSPSPSSPTLAPLLAADVPILVRTPFLAGPSAFSPYLHNPHALLVLDTALDPASATGTLVCARAGAAHGVSPQRVLCIDVSRAARGLAALRASSGPASEKADAVRRYQSDVLGSRLPVLLSALEETISRGPVSLHADARDALARHAVDAGENTVRDAKRETDDVRARVGALRAHVLEERERAFTEILGGGDAVDLKEGKEKGPIAQGVERVAADVRPTLDGLAWWRLPLVVDDVSTRVDRAVGRTYEKQFENELVFHTGRLAALQTRFVADTTALVAGLPPPLHSSVLQNTLAQLASAPSFRLAPPTPSPLSPSNAGLLAPLRARTAQLAHATRALHLAAQRTLLSSALATALSSALGYAAWLSSVLDGASAAGAGALGALLGLRWAVGRWERARRAWWADFFRVGGGLERDLRSGLGAVLERQVCAVPEEACRGVGSAVQRREAEVGRVEEELEGVRGVLNRLSAEQDTPEALERGEEKADGEK
ncbi:hypothetical protein DFH11DRAFT_1723085 [Phellopilus nigrolimitatus]|nr:hypothetical protein DFH11DRAFT_1723085 [Phellopilus nigrolimitatus]